MIGEILNAVVKECKALFADTGGTFILKTNYRSDNLRNYAMPLLLVDMVEGADTGQNHGGVTMADWMFALNTYNVAPDTYADDPTGYSTGLLNIIDTVRQHFSKGQWLTTDMTDMENNYCFKFTLSGIVSADALDADAVVMGYRIIFDSIAVDTSTSFVVMSEEVLEHVVQVNYPPAT